jgi:protein tyrosine phosphatase
MHTTDDEEAQSFFMASHLHSVSQLSSQFSNFQMGSAYNSYYPKNSQPLAVSMQDFFKNLKISTEQIEDLYQSVDERVKLTLPDPWPSCSSLGFLSRNSPLNKVLEFLPNDTFRVELKSTTENPDGYINATGIPLVSSLRHITAENANLEKGDKHQGKHAFGVSDVQLSKRIIAQTPNSEVASNAFWDMVFESEASLVVSFGNVPDSGVTGRFAIQSKFQTAENGYCTQVLDIEKVEVTQNQDPESRTPEFQNTITSTRIWYTTMLPLVGEISESDLITRMTYFFNEVLDCKRRVNPKRSIIFCCDDGVGLSGIFMLSDIVLQELIDARPTMPINLLEPLRVVRPNFLPEPKHLRFVYNLVSGWLSSNERLI